MIKIILLSTLFAAYCQAVTYEALILEQWRNFKLRYNKFYTSEQEEQDKLQAYMENLDKIAEHNKLYEMGLRSYHMAMNQFGDLYEDEFLRLHTSKLPQSNNLTSADVWGNDINEFAIYASPTYMKEDRLVEESVDWREKGYVTGVKNQGQCRSCWSFSAVGALEGQWFKSTGKLVSLSEKNLMDCSASEGNNGCNGGWMPAAYNYIIKNGGIDTEASYPYEAAVGNCRFNPNNIGAKVSNIVYVPQGENELKSKVASVGPIAVAIEMINSFQFYQGGVYDDPNCGKSLNHAVVLVGYGSERGHDYWLAKNSFGTNWGEAGYIKMARNKNDQCGISSAACYPIV